MAMSWKDNGHTLNAHDLEYLNKIKWLWNRLSLQQRDKIESSAMNNTLRQEDSKHCVIGEALGSSVTNTAQHDNLFLDAFLSLAKTVFYDGPSYDYLLGRKITRDEKQVLDDIYYAKIGNVGHQYRRANELVRLYVTSNVSLL